LNRLRVFLEEEIPGIKKNDLLCVFPNLFYPTAPSGKTTDLARLSSGGAGLNIAVKVIAVEKGQICRCFLGVEGKGQHNPKNPHAQKSNEKRFPFHRAHLDRVNLKTFIPHLPFENKNESSDEAAAKDIQKLKRGQLRQSVRSGLGIQNDFYGGVIPVGQIEGVFDFT
jgi:hypothetical protein